MVICDGFVRAAGAEGKINYPHNTPVLENQGHMRKRILGYVDGNSCSRRSVFFNGAFLLLTKRLFIAELFEQFTFGGISFGTVH